MTETPDPSRGYKHLLIYGDEVGQVGPHGLYAGYGTLWLPWERRGDFIRVLREVRTTHGYTGPIDIAHLSSSAEPFALALIDEIFRRRWICFRCLITKGDGAGDQRDLDAFSALTARRLKDLPGGIEGRDIRLRLSRGSRFKTPSGDPRWRLFDRRLTDLLRRPLDTRPSRSPEPLEVVQLLTAIVVSDWEKRPTSAHRKRLSDRAAENLGWGDLAADTPWTEWKFNIWYAPDPKADAESLSPQRAVQLRLPLVD